MSDVQEVLKKLEECYSLLQKKTGELNGQLGQVAKNKQETIGEKEKQTSITNVLNAKVRLLEKQEQGLKEAKEKVDKTLDLQKAVNEMVVKEKDVKSREDSLKNGNKELDELKVLYMKKMKNNDQLKVQLELEKKLMKENLLKELQGKLV